MHFIHNNAKINGYSNAQWKCTSKYSELQLCVSGCENKNPLLLSGFHCPGEDLNLHPVWDTALNRERLPVPPPGLMMEIL